MGGTCSTCLGEERRMQGFNGEFKRKRLLGRLRHVREGSIKTYLKEIERKEVDWIDLAEDRDDRRILMKMVMNLRIA